MRKDMAQVMSEGYRYGRGFIAKPGRPLLNLEDAPQREGMQAPYRGCWGARMKERRINLKPLRRFLEKQVGRPWSVVYREILQSIDNRVDANRSLLNILDYEATSRGLHVIDGEVYHRDFPHRPYQLYVHPVTGLLCRPARQYRPIKHREPSEKVISPTERLVKINGFWFRVKYRAFGDFKSDGKCFEDDVRDVVSGEVFSVKRSDYLDDTQLIAVHKKQLSKKELRAHQLR